MQLSAEVTIIIFCHFIYKIVALVLLFTQYIE